jgi:hypothetical protein
VAVNAQSVDQILDGVDTGWRNLRLRIGEGAVTPRMPGSCARNVGSAANNTAI